MPTNRHRLITPIGPLTLISDGEALVRIILPDEIRTEPEPGPGGSDDVIATACDQLNAYFAGTLHEFDLPLAPVGTAFQRRVWDELRRIPRGKTLSYAQLARRVGSPRGFRAVGAANGRNPLPVFVPCHRVVGANGRLKGFAGGLAAKAWLLRHEGAVESAHPKR